MAETTDGTAAEPGASYAYKASLIGSAHRFALTEDRLVWHVAGRSGLWPYTDIAAVRLSYRPISMQPRRFRADIDHVSGARVRVLSTTWQTVTLMKPQDNDYRAFLIALHRRLEEAGSKAALVGGLRPGLYHAAVAVLAIVAVSMSGLLIRALVTGEWAGALFLVGFAALFGWQIGGFIRRNRPRRYRFDEVPEELLP
ncbi:MAG TPA: hypothetical protein VGP39_24265 [Bradyrhizobium sp.]|nr:hypothetical protein [Bradyrhizobium sp.]